MSFLNFYKRTRFFLWVNITGLAIGLATSIMLILFVVNELSYDKHFANNERIVRLLTAYEDDNNLNFSPISLLKAYTSLPENVPGIETAVQIYDLGSNELIREGQHFQNVRTLLTGPEFFQVFQLKFIEGDPVTALEGTNSLVLTRRYADIVFGSPQAAIGKPVSIFETEMRVTAIVEELPKSTHFSFDVLANTKLFSWLSEVGGLEFHTYYLIKEGVSIEDTRALIEKEYTTLLEPWSKAVGVNAYGETEMLSKVYLQSKAERSLGTTSSMSFIWLLSGLALFILILAVTNFVNLFVTQGQMRMNEIGIRKANGATIDDIVRQFFKEVSGIVLFSFIIGFFIAIIFIPYFGELIGKNIDLKQLYTFPFIFSIILLFAFTVILSAFYPAFYLSRFTPLEILNKRVRFSKRTLTAGIVIFQSIVSIVLLSAILVFV